MKTFKEGDLIIAPNLEIYKFLLDYAKLKGVPVYKNTSVRSYKKWPNLRFTNGEITGSSGSLYNITINEFIQYCDNWKNIKIQLTSDYTALVDRQNQIVEVGCQKIPFHKIEELYRSITS